MPASYLPAHFLPCIEFCLLCVFGEPWETPCSCLLFSPPPHHGDFPYIPAIACVFPCLPPSAHGTVVCPPPLYLCVPTLPTFPLVLPAFACRWDWFGLPTPLLAGTPSCPHIACVAQGEGPGGGCLPACACLLPAPHWTAFCYFPLPPCVFSPTLPAPFCNLCVPAVTLPRGGASSAHSTWLPHGVCLPLPALPVPHMPSPHCPHCLLPVPHTQFGDDGTQTGFCCLPFCHLYTPAPQEEEDPVLPCPYASAPPHTAFTPSFSPIPTMPRFFLYFLPLYPHCFLHTIYHPFFLTSLRQTDSHLPFPLPPYLAGYLLHYTHCLALYTLPSPFYTFPFTPFVFILHLPCSCPCPFPICPSLCPLLPHLTFPLPHSPCPLFIYHFVPPLPPSHLLFIIQNRIFPFPWRRRKPCSFFLLPCRLYPLPLPSSLTLACPACLPTYLEGLFNIYLNCLPAPIHVV